MPSHRVQALAALVMTAFSTAAQPPPAPGATGAVPASEVLSYRVEWRLIHAGYAQLAWSPSASDGWAAHLHLESAGLVSKLYRVDNEYASQISPQLCIASSTLKTQEGSRRRETNVTFDAVRRKASYVDHDMVTGATSSNEIDIQACEHDVIGGLYQLRTLRLEPGRSVELPVSDGKKAVMAKVEAQERETIRTDFGTYKTIRCEAFLFNNVLYRRRGRLLLWLTDDNRRLPVQVRIRLPFYVGTITLQLEKDGRT
jgi:hypothetical protein